MKHNNHLMFQCVIEYWSVATKLMKSNGHQGVIDIGVGSVVIIVFQKVNK